MKYITGVILISLVASSTILARKSIPSDAQLVEERYSFETDFEGWTAHATDVNPNLPSPVSRSQVIAEDGANSLQFVINRDASFQDVWIEKVFDVAPYKVYDVGIDYALGTRDCCSNLFTILTGVMKKTPATLTDFISVLQEPLDNKENVSVGYKWIDKEYAHTTRSDGQGKLHVIIGIFGNSEFSRFEFIDRVHVKIAERVEPCEFYSFENDMEGWLPGSIDMDGGDGSSQAWSIGPSREQQASRDGVYCLRFFTRNSNKDAKVFISRPFTVERKSKYQIKVEYEFVNGSVTSGASLITGVLRAQPEIEDDLIPFYQERAQKFPEVHGWQRKQYQFTVRSKKADVLHVVIGIAARHSGQHLFAFDNVCVTVTKR